MKVAIAVLLFLRVHGKHERMDCSFPNTTDWSAALASPLVLAIPTLILTKHPLVFTTDVSVGSLVDPHVSTSSAVPEDTELIRDKTNLNPLAVEQVDPLTAGKLTFNQVPEGR